MNIETVYRTIGHEAFSCMQAHSFSMINNTLHFHTVKGKMVEVFVSKGNYHIVTTWQTTFKRKKLELTVNESNLRDAVVTTVFYK